MATLKFPPKIPPAPPWWDSLALILDFSPRQSRLFWSALAVSRDPSMVALIYRCGQHEAYLKGQRLDLLRDGIKLHDFLTQTWSPHCMVLALERLHREGLLSRATCSAFEQKFLTRTGRDGRWTTPH